MTSTFAPLLDLFIELRQRGFPLGVDEYLCSLRTLSEEIGVNSRKELLFVCQALWAKSLEERRQIAEAIDETLPPEFTVVEFESLIQLIESALGGQVGSQPAPSAMTEAPKSEETKSSRASNMQPESSAKAHSESGSLSQPNLSWSTASPDFSVSGPAPRTWKLNPNLDFSGQLPITQRQMKRAWRYFRRVRRSGQPVVLDVTATVERMYRQGVMIEPVLIPRRTNFARLMLLIDEGGSMNPFRRITRPLIESAQQSGLERMGVYYFHDAPKKHLFREAWLKTHILCEEALQEFAAAGVLIISDGGAARGNLEQTRIALTSRFIQTLRKFTPHVAWLNPMPSARWPGSSADAIRNQCQLPMFTFDRAGLDAAVDVLRGRSKIQTRR